MLSECTVDVAVIGAGAAGLMAGLFAQRAGADTIILERNEKPGKKIYITGKGRCNVTNLCDTEAFLAQVPRNPRFLYAALNFLSPRQLMDLLTDLGCPLKLERGQRVFPVSDKASDVTRALVNGLKPGTLQLSSRVTDVIIDDKQLVLVRLEDGSVVKARHVIVATGGLSYPVTGSTGDGYLFARSMGHQILPCSPALVPFDTKSEWPKLTQGLALKNVLLTAKLGNKTVLSEQGELLMTHFGLSGPLALSLSSFLDPSRIAAYQIAIDLKPAVSHEQLSKRLNDLVAANGRQLFRSILGGFLPRSLAEIFPSLCGVDGAKQLSQLSGADRQAFVNTLKALPVELSGFRSFKEAVITRGGVDVRDTDPKTMRSKRVPSVSFCGEVLDVDALTGGYNLQIAFATGALAGACAAKACFDDRKDPAI